MNITGVVSVLPTPFRAGGDVDAPSLARLVDLVITAGVQAIAVLGAAGEASRLTERERLSVVDAVLSQVAGRRPVLVETSSDGVRTCLEFSRQIKALGATAAIISPPRAQRLSVESIVNHYRLVAEALDLPIVVQDAPAQCGVTMDAGLLVRIARATGAGSFGGSFATRCFVTAEAIACPAHRLPKLQSARLERRPSSRLAPPSRWPQSWCTTRCSSATLRCAACSTAGVIFPTPHSRWCVWQRR